MVNKKLKNKNKIMNFIKLNYPNFWKSKNFITFLLLPVVFLYQILTLLRKIFVKTKKLSQFVICVGNISVGGTGKTQLIILLTELLNKNGIDYVIVTKAYGGNIKDYVFVDPKYHTAINVGDESLMLANYGKVIACPKYSKLVDISNNIKEKVILMDDGMQNPHIYKNFNILTFDTERMNGNKLLFPAGPLRQSIDSAIMNANLALFIGNGEDYIDFDLIKKMQNNNLKYFDAIIEREGQIEQNKNFIAICAIGNPNKFFTLLEKNKIKIIRKISYPDHHHYSMKDLKEIMEIAISHNAKILTTHKDYVKLEKLFESLEEDDKELKKYKISDIICVKVKLMVKEKKKLENIILSAINSYESEDITS